MAENGGAANNHQRNGISSVKAMAYQQRNDAKSRRRMSNGAQQWLTHQRQ